MAEYDFVIPLCFYSTVVQTLYDVLIHYKIPIAVLLLIVVLYCFCSKPVMLL